MMNGKGLERRALLRGLAAAAALRAAAARADTVSDIKARGKVVIGIQGDNPPWGFVNSSGVQEGFDAGVGKGFAAFLGVQPEFMPLTVANRIPALTTERCDVLFASMGMLPERAKAVQYSKPYFANIITLVAAKTTEVKTNADMGKLVIGVPRSSVGDAQVTNNAPPGTTIRRFDDDGATIQALLSGQVEAVGANMFYLDRLNASKPGVFENKLEFTRLYNGACSRLGDKAMNAALNGFIDQARTDGTLAAAYRTWMKLDVPSFPDSVEGVPFTVA